MAKYDGEVAARRGGKYQFISPMWSERFVFGTDDKESIMEWQIKIEFSIRRRNASPKHLRITLALETCCHIKLRDSVKRCSCCGNSKSTVLGLSELLTDW